MLLRMLHNQIWITLSRYLCARGNNRILDKGIEFDQVDRERNCAVEFLYYWLHRALHHHFLYSRYHSHHHSSIVTEPISAVIHPFAELVAYFILFAIPLLITVHTRTASMASVFGYVIYIDFMNNLGHCNFELIPKWLFSMLPPLKYFIYSPSYHSLHHTQFRTNYSLFMPLYDYIYDKMDKSSDSLYELSLKRGKESPNIVYLVHLMTPRSIYHLGLGFAGLASKPYVSKWYLRLMWPVTTLLSMILSWKHGHPFVVERNHFDKLSIQTWAIPKYKTQYLQLKNSSIDRLIEEAVLDAEENNVEVLSLGLLNQSEEMNAYGEVYVKRHPELKMKIVDGSSLATALVLNTIPKGTTQVLLRGKLTKVTYAIVSSLCQKGVQVSTLHMDEYGKLVKSLTDVKSASNNLLLSNCYSQKNLNCVFEFKRVF
ncbi:hypothetical protein TIFTF001_038815 [Ficus carica]|uniref:Fatty acid hydroxylase domain-containing protein n=1 Tax=Ficus carica TaxID=3494 RepID=A0AA88JDF4_FICCA|nr:hypothetical protein TIFTF001_038815 [Ficus carica]